MKDVRARSWAGTNLEAGVNDKVLGQASYFALVGLDGEVEQRINRWKAAFDYRLELVRSIARSLLSLC